MKKNTVFYILCVVCTFLFLLVFSKFLHIKAPQNLFPPAFNTMNIILETKTNHPTDILAKINESYYDIPVSKNLLNRTIKTKVNSFDILVKKDFKNEIKNIVIFNDTKTYYFKDFSDFKKEDVTLCPNGECLKYTKYEVPKTVQSNKHSKTYNFSSLQNTFCSFVFHALSGRVVFFIPYLFLFFTVFYYIKQKPELPKISSRGCFWVIFVLGILIYSNGLFSYLPWVDEYHTIEFSDPKAPFSTLFSDPGNPFLFYFLFRIFIGFFGVSVATTRLFPFIISILFIFALYFVLYKNFDKKTALVGVCLAFVNVPLIYYAQEARCYILQALFTPLIMHFLFKIFKENKTKDYVIYGVLVALASNTHYYEILLLFSNFIFALFLFLSQKRYKDLLKFALANLVGALFFLPFFIMTAYNKALVDSSFNTWIPPICFDQIKKCVFYLFGGGVSLLLSSAFFIKTFFEKENSKRKTVILYSFFAIVFTIFQAVLLSYLIRPMLVERYLILLSPIFAIFLSVIFTSKYKNQYAALLFTFWIITMEGSFFEKSNRTKSLIEMPMLFSKQYYKQHKNENIYVIVNFSNPEYLEDKETYMTDKITYFAKSMHDIENEIKKILVKNKKAIIFTNLLEPNKENSTLSKNYTCYFNSSADMCLWKIEK